MRTVAVMLMALAAYAAPRDGDYGRHGPGPGRGFGIVERTLQDLRRAAMNARLDGHERKHFHEAAKELDKFRDRWRDGRFETKHLDKAIENIAHLTYADRIHPRDRSILANDLEALRDFRAGRGYGGPYPRGGGGVWRR